MEAIKFRGKDENGKWVYGGINENETAIVRGFVLTAVAPETVGQFTRAYDSEGKEIYEGDFLLIDGDGVQVYRDVCGWIIGNPALVKAYGLYDCSLNEANLSKARVIGNLYDNPEMAANLP